MSAGAPFLATAPSRLLPLSVPFQFFVAAALFHLGFWLMLAAAAEQVPGFKGGLGTPLGAVHLLTLGVLAMTAIGASLQLLPVVSRQAVPVIWPCHAVAALMVIGVPLLAWGMAAVSPPLMTAGGLAVSAGLAGYLALVGGNLIRARGHALVTAFCWAALVALVGLTLLGLVLIADLEQGFLRDHTVVAALHFVLAVFGFMGLLAFGFSFILVPMFALARGVSDRTGRLILATALGAIALACVGVTAGSAWVTALAFTAGLAASLLYGLASWRIVKSGLRKRLGRSFLLIRISWVLLPFGLILGLGTAWGLLPDRAWGLFGFVLLAGWLLTFLTGILQRIVPFLASMHSAASGAPPALLSSLTPERPLSIHAGCHLGALALFGAGLSIGGPVLVRAGCLVGAAGALSFLVFTLEVLRRLARHRRRAPGKETPA